MSAETTHRLCVAVDTPQHSGLSAPLDYLSPIAHAPGTLVQVPLGKRELLGIVWDAPADAQPPLEDSQLRPIGDALDALPPLNAAWRQLLTFAATYYQRSIGELALSVLPPQLRELSAAQLQQRLKKLAKLPATAAASAPSTSAPSPPITMRPACAGRATHSAVRMIGAARASVFCQAKAELNPPL